MASGDLLSLEQCVSLACLLEVSSPKVGNVHRSADFDDVTFNHFTISAIVAAPHLARATNLGVGQAVYRAVEATQQAVASNTNLGIALLLAPLAAARSQGEDTRKHLPEVLAALTPDDADWAYRAIRLAKPGGLGEADSMDVNAPPPESLLAAMQAAADRDLVAMQYANGFAQVFDEAAMWIEESVQSGHALTTSIVYAHLRLLAAHPDTLIARKCGQATADKAMVMAQQVVDLGGPGDEAFWEAAGDFDFWLRSDHHKRNPGAAADLITAAIFVLLAEGRVKPVQATG